MDLDVDAFHGLYRQAIALSPAETPPTRSAEHTMGAAVDAYAFQRLPADLLDMVLDAGMKLEVHGIHPDHFTAVWPGARLMHPGHLFGPGKVFNIVRPRFFVSDGPGRTGSAGRTLIMAVPPGRDYVLHNARIVRQYLQARGLDPGLLRSVVRYPDAERGIAEWTGLPRLVRPGDRVLMGYVREVVSHWLRRGAAVTDEDGSDYYGVTRLLLPNGERVCALGVRFSFWGSIAANLAVACAGAGADEIIYAGKLGTLASPDDIYTRLFVPSGYLRLTGPPELLKEADAPRNGVLEHFPHLSTGLHMSVATVLEEDLAQRALGMGYGVESIDNEISQMAHAIAAWNSATGRAVAFSCVHFATDYLRRPDEPERPGRFDLTTHRHGGALRLKRSILRRVSRLLFEYYMTDSTGWNAAGPPIPAGASRPVNDE
ncbi:hypothetical protein E1264_01750 [Actinomadura sp. KC216]|uniref:hypothetical protein n=1 Tax=Actinomadura sp. KC216 TaxID=2530370 RepID=UPI001047EF40|nr:hypothetical protein [Actinomadura sp. KC216]TDB91379.1 hypothetical protein E1264_01750 [Actinomadura sp. KC216]